ncbi:hypothetical protein PYCC9005_004948 [Savitreella phatthalungensis]
MPPSNSAATSLKRAEGVALTRLDLQFSTLEKIFADDKKVWRSQYEPDLPPMTFYDLYLEDFFHSTRLSKSLYDRHKADPENCIKTTYVNLLCNVGRINTTLIFTPTQMRLFNPVPCLQVHDKVSKLLQDAPRLKAILKASCDRADISPPTFEALQKLMADPGLEPPFSSPINLVFVISAEEDRLERHFEPGMDFHQLFSRPDLDSSDRANAFLWLMWFYMMTDGTARGQITNPYGTGHASTTVPLLRPVDSEQSALENIELPEELEYAKEMFDERQRWLRAALAKLEAQPQGDDESAIGDDEEATTTGRTPVPAALRRKIVTDDNGNLLPCSLQEMEQASANAKREEEASMAGETPTARRSRPSKRKYDIDNDDDLTTASRANGARSFYETRVPESRANGELKTELALQRFKSVRTEQLIRQRLRYTRASARRRRLATPAILREARYINARPANRVEDLDNDWRPSHVTAFPARRLSVDYTLSTEEIRPMLEEPNAREDQSRPAAVLAGEEADTICTALKRAERIIAARRNEPPPTFTQADLDRFLEGPGQGQAFLMKDLIPAAVLTNTAQPPPPVSTPSAKPPAAAVDTSSVAADALAKSSSAKPTPSTMIPEELMTKQDKERARRAAAARARRAAARAIREAARTVTEGGRGDENDPDVGGDADATADVEEDEIARPYKSRPHLLMPSSPPVSDYSSVRRSSIASADDNDDDTEISNLRDRGVRASRTLSSSPPRRDGYSSDLTDEEDGDEDDDGYSDNTYDGRDRWAARGLQNTEAYHPVTPQSQQQQQQQQMAKSRLWQTTNRHPESDSLDDEDDLSDEDGRSSGESASFDGDDDDDRNIDDDSYDEDDGDISQDEEAPLPTPVAPRSADPAPSRIKFKLKGF